MPQLIDTKSITLDTKLQDIFPRDNRRQKIKDTFFRRLPLATRQTNSLLNDKIEILCKKQWKWASVKTVNHLYMGNFALIVDKRYILKMTNQSGNIFGSCFTIAIFLAEQIFLAPCLVPRSQH